MTKNNAASRVLTDEEIQDIADGFDIYGAKPEFARAIEQAVLSKLRAPVADERAVIAEATGHVTEALIYVDRVAQRKAIGYADFGTNPRRNHSDTRPYNLKDARSDAYTAAILLRKAWGILDPSISFKPATALASAPVADDWTPTPANINALPEPVRNYVHQLVANADPAGMVAENVLLRDQTRQLDAMIGRLKEDVAYTAGMMTLEDAKKILGVPRVHAGLMLLSGERVIGSPRAIREIKSMAAAAGRNVYQYWENEDGR